MVALSYDIIMVGGGIAASALPIAMAGHGAKVLILEREKQFKDRARGEGIVPWGVAEAYELGIYGLLKETCAHEVPQVEGGTGSGLRDLRMTTPQQLPLLSFAHHVMQESLLAAAENAGAEVRRGVRVECIECGTVPTVIVNGQSHEPISARLVVAADGRNSAARKWAGAAFNPEIGTWTGLIPQADDRFRAYFVYPKTMGYRLQGKSMLNHFFHESARGYAPLADYYADAKSGGPLASFDASDDWIEHPYRDGVALVGDAAATSDPTYGQGFLLPSVVRECCAMNLSAIPIGMRQDIGTRINISAVFGPATPSRAGIARFFKTLSPKSAALRAKAIPRIADDPTRVPDHILSGPDLPLNEKVRARFFGEC